jgi:hypothetical protein
MGIEETIEKYYVTKQRIQELEEKLARYKSIIEKEVEKKETFGSYTVQKRTIKNERINKKDCPSDIWKTYAKTSLYTTLDIKKQSEIKKSI